MNYYKKDIKNVRGDTYSIGMTVDQELDTVFFTIRDSLNDNSNVLVQKSLGNGITITETEPTEEGTIYKYAIRIAPTDTDEIQAGTYFYDLQIAEDYDVFTIMKGKFIIEQDATRGDEPPEEEIIVQIKAQLDEINGETVSVYVFDKLDYLEATKGQIKDSLNVLGADLTDESTFRSYVAKIDNIYDNYPTINEEGSEITITPTIKAKLKDIDLKGNTSQTTYSGKNQAVVCNGIWYSDDGTFTSTSQCYGFKTKIEPDTTYTISKKNAGNRFVVLLGANDVIVNNQYRQRIIAESNTDRTTYTFTSGSSDNYVFFGCYRGTDTSAQQLACENVQIEQGSTATSYEPYVGGIPSPNPDYPQDVRVVTGNNTIQITDGTNTQSYPITLGDIELCKIGDYQDYLYKQDNKWYKHSAIGKVVFHGTENWTLNQYNYFQTDVSNSTSDSSKRNGYCSHFKYEYNTGNNNIFFMVDNLIRIKCTDFSNANDFKIWLSNNNVTVYYILATVTDTEITDETLISQLEAIQNAYSYDTATTISSEYTETNAQFIISASALMKGGN